MVKNGRNFFRSNFFQMSFKWFWGVKYIVFDSFQWLLGVLEALWDHKCKKWPKRVIFSLPDFFQMTYRVDIYCFWLIVWSKSAIDWLSARSASTLIKPRAIWVLNFIRANGRWRTLVIYTYKNEIPSVCVSVRLSVSHHFCARGLTAGILIWYWHEAQCPGSVLVRVSFPLVASGPSYGRL